MARRIIHQLVDDIDGTVLEIGEGETVLFSLDGTAYEVDLSDSNAQAFRNALAPYVSAARSISSARRASNAGGGTQRRRTGQVNYAPVRAWAKENGFRISERGRVPASVIEAYEAAH